MRWRHSTVILRPTSPCKRQLRSFFKGRLLKEALSVPANYVWEVSMTPENVGPHVEDNPKRKQQHSVEIRDVATGLWIWRLDSRQPTAIVVLKPDHVRDVIRSCAAIMRVRLAPGSSFPTAKPNRFWW